MVIDKNSRSGLPGCMVGKVLGWAAKVDEVIDSREGGGWVETGSVTAKESSISCCCGAFLERSLQANGVST